MKKKIEHILQVGRDNPRARAIAVVLLALMLVFIVWLIIQADRASSAIGGSSSLPSVSLDNATRGYSSEQYLKTQLLANRRLEQEAAQNGQSYVAVPIDNASFSEPQGRSAQNIIQQLLAHPNTRARLLAYQDQFTAGSLSPSLFAAQLLQAVRDKKLTPTQARDILQANGLSPDLLRDAQVADGSGSTKDYVNQLANTPILDSPNQLLAEAEKSGESPQSFLTALRLNPGYSKLSKQQKDAIKTAFSQLQKDCPSGVTTVTSAACAGDRAALAMALNAVPSPDSIAAVQQALSTSSQSGTSQQSQAVLSAALAKMVRDGELPASTAKDILSHFNNNAEAAAEIQAMGGASQDSAPQTLIQQEQEQVRQAQALQDKQQQEAAAAQQKAAQDQYVDTLKAAMLAQENEIVKSWTPVRQQVVIGDQESGDNGSGMGVNGMSGTMSSLQGTPLLTMGSILFAQLDTGVNTDYPDTHVMATIIDGPLKGSKLMGELKSSPNVNADRVELSFDTMLIKGQNNVTPISAVAIDPNNARLAMASDVDHHYISRYGSLFAASFLQGYSQSLQQEGSVTYPTIFGPEQVFTKTLSPLNRVAMGLGQVGTNLSNSVMNNFNRPTTVTLDAGIGIGILFTKSVPTQMQARAQQQVALAQAAQTKEKAKTTA